MPREMLKLRKGDAAIMIKKDGGIDLAGVEDKPLVDSKGNISPIVLFAAAWARRDNHVLAILIDNFKKSVREGLFGQDAKDDLINAENAASSAAVTQSTPSAPKIIPNQTPEEFAKQKREEERLRNIANSMPPEQQEKIKRSQKEIMKGASKIGKKDFDMHREPDLPVEQTMDYQKASPEEQKRMKEEEQKKKAASAAVTLESIEEGVK